MSKTYDVAVVGATGVVGESMLEILAERKFPVGKVYALASDCLLYTSDAADERVRV